MSSKTDHVTKVVTMLEEWYVENYEDDEDDESIELEEHAAYGVELARMVPNRIPIALALLEQLENRAAMLVAIAGDDDDGTIAFARRLFVLVLRETFIASPELGFMYDLLVDFDMLRQAREREDSDAVELLLEQLEATKVGFGHEIDADFDDYDDEFGDHPLVEATAIGCQLMSAETMPAACFRLDRALEMWSTRFGSACIDAVLERFARSLQADIPPVHRPHRQPGAHTAPLAPPAPEVELYGAPREASVAAVQLRRELGSLGIQIDEEEEGFGRGPW